MKTYKCIFLTITSIVGLFVLTACLTLQEERTTNTDRGNRIIEAIRQYEQANKEEPQSLNQLFPEFIPEISETVTGESFHYQAYDKFSYGKWTLTFYIERNNTGCTYISHLDFWDCWPPNAGGH